MLQGRITPHGEAVCAGAQSPLQAANKTTNRTKPICKMINITDGWVFGGTWIWTTIAVLLAALLVDSISKLPRK